jgi:hypothetical protein
MGEFEDVEVGPAVCRRGCRGGERARALGLVLYFPKDTLKPTSRIPPRPEPTVKFKSNFRKVGLLRADPHIANELTLDPSALGVNRVARVPRDVQIGIKSLLIDIGDNPRKRIESPEI